MSKRNGIFGLTFGLSDSINLDFSEFTVKSNCFFNPKASKILLIMVFSQMCYNVYVYELWRVSAQTFPDKNWLWKIRRIFQVRTDQAIAYILLCCQLFSISFFNSVLFSIRKTFINSSNSFW